MSDRFLALAFGLLLSACSSSAKPRGGEAASSGVAVTPIALREPGKTKHPKTQTSRAVAAASDRRDGSEVFVSRRRPGIGERLVDGALLIDGGNGWSITARGNRPPRPLFSGGSGRSRSGARVRFQHKGYGYNKQGCEIFPVYEFSGVEASDRGAEHAGERSWRPKLKIELPPPEKRKEELGPEPAEGVILGTSPQD